MGYYKLSDDMEHLGIEMRDGFGVFAVDFAAFFPYVNQDDLILRMSLSTEACAGGCVIINLHEECVFNHRYPNTGYVCMTMKSGRKRSKLGCFLQLSYEELNMLKYMNIEYGFREDNMARMSIPVNMNVSEAAPCAGMEIHLGLKDPNDPSIHIEVREHERGGWRPFTYALCNDDMFINMERFGLDKCIVLKPCDEVAHMDERSWITFETAVNCIPSILENMMI